MAIREMVVTLILGADPTVSDEMLEQVSEEVVTTLADIAHVSDVTVRLVPETTTHDSRCTLGSEHEGECNWREWRG